MMKIVPEALNEFHKSGDPLSSLGVGIKNVDDYVEAICKENKFDADKFWKNYYQMLFRESETCDDLIDIILDVLKHTPLDYQIEHIKNDFETWLENGGMFYD